MKGKLQQVLIFVCVLESGFCCFSNNKSNSNLVTLGATITPVTTATRTTATTTTTTRTTATTTTTTKTETLTTTNPIEPAFELSNHTK